MVRFTVHSLGEHQIENLVVTGPFKEIVMTMAELFLASYSGDPQDDLDLHLAKARSSSILLHPQKRSISSFLIPHLLALA